MSLIQKLVPPPQSGGPTLLEPLTYTLSWLVHYYRDHITLALFILIYSYISALFGLKKVFKYFKQVRNTSNHIYLSLEAQLQNLTI
jgi:hypothetical protein